MSCTYFKIVHFTNCTVEIEYSVKCASLQYVQYVQNICIYSRWAMLLELLSNVFFIVYWLAIPEVSEKDVVCSVVFVIKKIEYC